MMLLYFLFIFFIFFLFPWVFCVLFKNIKQKVLRVIVLIVLLGIMFLFCYFSMRLVIFMEDTSPSGEEIDWSRMKNGEYIDE
jgi:hypothetical protein